MSEEGFAWLYGSVARGDADEKSDIDVLVVGQVDLARVTMEVSSTATDKLSISAYSGEEIDAMAARGSLFLRHLHKEGKPLYGTQHQHDGMRRVLRSLPAYKDARRDIDGFDFFLNEIRSVATNGDTAFFDLRSITAAIRHACILGCYLHNCESYSRLGPVQGFLGTFLPAPMAHVRLFAESYRSCRDEEPSSTMAVNERISTMTDLLETVLRRLNNVERERKQATSRSY